jgi:outer membrane protein assembly factor BamB
MRRHETVMVAAMVLAVSAGGSLAQVQDRSGADWPHWQGPDRTDITRETSGWDEGAWPIGESAWTASVGAGASTPIVVGDRVYTIGWADGDDHLYCLDAATGQVVWEQRYPCPQHGRYATTNRQIWSGPSSTPEYDAETSWLYTLSNDGDLNCWDGNRGGAKVWGCNLFDTYGVQRRPVPAAGGGAEDYGYTTAPLVYGDWVIVEVGDDEGNLMGFDKRTGQRRWVSECKDPAGHTGGLVPMVVEGVPCVVVLTVQRLLVARLDPGLEGRTVATHEWQAAYNNNIPTPAVYGDSVVLTTAHTKRGMARLRISLAGAEVVWDSPNPSQVCSPVIYNGHVYHAWQDVRCLDFETGGLDWKGAQFGADGSCLVTGDGRLIVFGGKRIGLVETADRSPDACTVLSLRAGVGSPNSWPHVVLAGGRLLARDREGSLSCFALTSPRSPVSILTFAAQDADPDWGGDWGLWPQVAGCQGETAWVAQDAEGGAGGSMRITYDIGAEPRSFSIWLAPGRNVNLAAHDRFVIYARGDVPSFTLVVKDRSAAPDGATDAGIADLVVTGVTGQWQRFELPFADFVPRVAGAAIEWRAVNHVGVAMMADRNATSGTLQVDNLRAVAAD